MEARWPSNPAPLNVTGDKMVLTSAAMLSFTRKEPGGKTQRVKTSQNFADEKMFAEDISEDVSEDRRYRFYIGF